MTVRGRVPSVGLRVIRKRTTGVHTDRVIASYDDWLDGLDLTLRAEARHCLLAGTYSRRLLLSLRATGPQVSRRERGLDDPEKAQPGDPLGANLQTFLRERLMSRAPEPSRLTSVGASPRRP